MKNHFCTILIMIISLFVSAQDLSRWHYSNQNSYYNFEDITWGNGLFVCIDRASIWKSTDGLKWIPKNLANLKMHAVCFGYDQFIIVGEDGLVMASPDGATWNQSTIPEAPDLQTLVFWNNLFVAGGTNGSLFTSEDGIAWTDRSLGITETVTDIAWNRFMFIAVTTGSNIFKSSDGLSWSPGLFGSPVYDFNTVIWHGNRFLINGMGIDHLFSSTDGTTWDSPGAVGFPESPQLLFSFGDRVLACAGDKLYSTNDPQIWAENQNLQSMETQAMAWSGSTLVLVGPQGKIAAAHSLGQESWTGGYIGSPHTLVDVIWNGSAWVACSSAGKIFRSLNGTDWMTAQLPGFPLINAMCFKDGTYIAVGNTGKIFKSTDGLQWDLIPSGTAENLNDVCWNGTHTLHEGFVAVGDSGTILVADTGGDSWSDQSVLISEDFQCVAVQASTALITIGGTNGVLYTRGLLGNWYALASPTSENVSCMNYSESTMLLIGTEEGKVFKRPDSSFVWSQTLQDSVINTIGFSQEKGFLATGAWGTIHQSPDGVVWTSYAGLTNTRRLLAAASNGSQSLLVGAEGYMVQSVPVLSQTRYQAYSGSSLASLHAMASNGKQWYAIGSGETILSSADGMVWSEDQVNAGPGTFSGMIDDGAGFVVVGGETVLYRTYEDLDWTTASPFVGANIKAIAHNGIRYAGSRYVAVGDQGVIYRSDNHTTWQVCASGTTANLNGIIFNEGLFYAYGENGALLSSSDGILWTPQNAHTSANITGLAMNPFKGTKVAALDDGSYSYSFIANTWANYVAISSNPLVGVQFTGSTFIILDSSGKLFLSDVGNHWNQGFGLSGATYENLAWDGKNLSGLGHSQQGFPVIQQLPGVYGHRFSSHSFPSSIPYNAILNDGKRLITVGNGGEIAIGSLDGIDWDVFNVGVQSFYCIGWNGVTYVAGGTDGMLYTSLDALNWSPVDSGTIEYLWDIIWWGDRFYACGQSGVILSSPDGQAWTPQNSGTTQALHCFAANMGTLIAAGDIGTIRITSNGTVWNNPTSPVAGLSTIKDMVWTGKRFIGVVKHRITTSLDGQVWRDIWLPDNLNNNLIQCSNQVVSIGAAEGIWSGSVEGGWVYHHVGTPLCATSSQAGVQFFTSRGMWTNGAYELDLPVQFEGEPETQLVCPGTTAQIQVESDSNIPMSYFWRKGGAFVWPEEQQPVLEISSFQVTNEGVYDCLVSNGFNFNSSPQIELLEGDVPSVSLPGSFVQGLQPVTLGATVNCEPVNSSSEWLDLGAMTVIGSDINPFTFSGILSETMPVRFTLTDNTTLEEWQVETVILVSDNPDYLDLNGDGCNNLFDLWLAAENWRQPAPDADGDGIVTVLDLLFINLDDPQNCP